MTDQYLSVIGKRIDAVHKMILSSEPGSWAHNYWTNVLSSLQRDWQRAVMEDNTNA